MGYGRIYTDDFMTKLQEVLNQVSDGLYSIQQAKPIVKKIVKEIEGDLSGLSEEILKYDKIIEVDEMKGDTAAWRTSRE
jgi:predicted metal-dependent enzyme (double-stranded beta helix superfamily)